MDVGDLMPSGWRQQSASDYIAAVRVGLDYANARECTLGGSPLGKNCLQHEVRQVSGQSDKSQNKVGSKSSQVKSSQNFRHEVKMSH